MSVERPDVDHEFVEFFTSGTQLTGEFHCASCGYGIVSRAELPDCPLCHESTWEPAPWRTFARAGNGAEASLGDGARRAVRPVATVISTQANDERGREP